MYARGQTESALPVFLEGQVPITLSMELQQTCSVQAISSGKKKRRKEMERPPVWMRPPRRPPRLLQGTATGARQPQASRWNDNSDTARMRDGRDSDTDTATATTGREGKRGRPRCKVRAACPENVKSDGEILGFVAGRTELAVLVLEEGVWRKGMVVKMNGTITAVAFEADGMVETLNMDLLGDRTTYRVTRGPATDSCQPDDGWDEENHLGHMTSREFGRRRAFSITQTPDTPRSIKKAHKRGIFHMTLHREGYVIIRSAVPVADCVSKIMTDMDKTSLFNQSKQKNEDVPDDRKRRTRVLGMVPTPDMPEELAALQNAVTDIMEEHSVIWDGGRFVSVWSILESVKGCQQQRHHTDFAPEDLNDLDTTEMPLSMIVAVQDGARLCIWDDEHRHARSVQKGDAHGEFEFGAPRTIVLNTGDIAFWRGDVVHCGAPYDHSNVRLFAYLSTPRVIHTENTVYFVE